MKARLLIAEGDAELCDLYQMYFAERGYEVETAQDGLSCLAKLQRTMPAVLVLDRELLWGGGDGVLAWLRQQRAPSGTCVILTTTAGDALDGAADIQAPVVQLLPKPFTLTALLESVRLAVANKECEQPFYLDHTAPCSELFIG